MFIFSGLKTIKTDSIFQDNLGMELLKEVAAVEAMDSR